MRHTIVKKSVLTPDLIQLDFLAPRIAKATKPGQFLIVRAYDDSERVPLTIAASDAETGVISIIFQMIGVSTMKLGELEEGDALASATGPLGTPSDFHGAKRVLCIGGGVGTAVLFPQVTALHKMGIPVDTIIGARNKDYLILEKELGCAASTFTCVPMTAARACTALSPTSSRPCWSRGSTKICALPSAPR